MCLTITNSWPIKEKKNPQTTFLTWLDIWLSINLQKQFPLIWCFDDVVERYVTKIFCMCVGTIIFKETNHIRMDGLKVTLNIFVNLQ